jgi:hypothetical protein
MVNNEVTKQLLEITSPDDLAERADELVEEWWEAGLGLDAVESVLRFMETNSLWDFGMPGALVHFVERFYGKGYEKLLMESLLRHATAHTAWMLNRVVNGEKNAEKRKHYINLMRQAERNSGIDSIAREQLNRFLALHHAS